VTELAAEDSLHPIPCCAICGAGARSRHSASRPPGWRRTIAPSQ